MISSPIFESSLHNLQLEREDTFKDVSSRVKGFDSIEHGEEVCTLCRCLIK